MLPSHARRIGCVVCLFVIFGLNGLVQATDWLTAKSRYSHDSETGERVNQYAPLPTVYHTPNPNKSVYRHTRSTLQVQDSVDYYHAVEKYGDTVRPYEEWRFPYRPFGVPYDQWGPTGFGGFGGGGYPYPGNGGPFFPTPIPLPGLFGGFGGFWGPFGPGGVVNGTGWPLPWNDGYYPDVRREQLPPQPIIIP